MKIKLLLCSLFIASNFVLASNILSKQSSSFECDTLPSNVKLLWGKKTDAQLTSEDCYKGKKSLKVTFDKKLLRVFIHSAEQTFKKGETYTISAFVKTTNSDKSIGFFLSSYNKLWKDGAKTHRFEQRPVTTDWRQIKMTAKLQCDGKLLGMYLLGKPGQVLFIDEVKIEKGKNASWSEPEVKSLVTNYQLKNPEIIEYNPSFSKNFAKGNWSNVKTINRLIRTSGDSKKTPQKTSLQLVADNKYLYVRFVCEENNLDKMVSKSLPNVPVWDDDRVELHFNFSGLKLRNNIKAFSVNSVGVYSTDFAGNDNTFAVKTKKGNSQWEVSYRLPIDKLGFQIAPGVTWKISAGRFHRTLRKETSAFAKTKFHFNRDTEAFLGFVLANNKTVLPKVILIDAGEVTDFDNNTGGNALSFWVAKELAKTNIKVRVNGKITPIYKLGQNLTTYYSLTGKKDEKLSIEVLDNNNKILLKNQINAKVFRDTERVYRTKEPFVFKEVFGQKRNKPRVNVTWTLLVDKRNYQDALKTGVAYSQEKVYKELKDAGIHLIIRNGMSIYSQLPSIRKGNMPVPTNKPEMSEVPNLLKKKLALPVCHYSFYFISGVDKNGKLGTTAGETGFFGLLIDPINKKAYLDSVEKIMDVHGKDMNIFFLGDEVIPLNIYRGRTMNKPYNSKEFLTKWNNDVKAKEGGNKFGIPWNIKTNDPKFNPSDRAYRAYMAEEITKIAEKAAAIAKKKKPSITILSDDAYGIPSVHGVQHWSRYADCGSFQLGEAGIVSRKDWPGLMFISKMIKDVSILNDLTVVIHEAVSGYPTGAMSPAEMLECYSQVIRGGATGFHFWPASMGQRYSWDGASQSIAIGYPTGYKYLLAMSKALTQMPNLKFPDTKTAVLISDDSLMFDKKGYDAFKRAFIVIGEQLGGWFKFVSDTHLHRKDETLSKYNLVYVPYGSYLKKETLTILENFVKNGGTVICGDPQFADFNIHGEKVDLLKNSFGKITYQNSKLTRRKLANGIVVNAYKSFITGKNDKVLAKYDNGDIAIFEKKFGKGKIIISGFELFNFQNNYLDSFIAKLHKANGGTTNHKIWNFKFPDPKISAFQPKAGKCLTGNYGYWDRHKFYAGKFQNENNKWSCLVTKNGKQAKSTKLLDRLNYFKLQKDFKKGTPDTWIEHFNSGKHSIVLKNNSSTNINEFVMYYAGKATNFVIETSNDSKVWKKYSAPANLQATENEVKHLSIPCVSKCKEIRLTFNVASNTKFTVAEVEVWNK